MTSKGLKITQVMQSLYLDYRIKILLAIIIVATAAIVIVNNSLLPPHHITIRTGYFDSSDSFLATLPKKFNFDRPFDCNFLLPTTII
jgi:hypothetical protein